MPGSGVEVPTVKKTLAGWKGSKGSQSSTREEGLFIGRLAQATEWLKRAQGTGEASDHPQLAASSRR